MSAAAHDAAMAATRWLFVLSCVVAVSVCLYYVMAMHANSLVSIALSILLATAFCSFGAHDIISYQPPGEEEGRQHHLTAWLFAMAIAAVGWPIALAELINNFSLHNAEPLTACTAGACASIGVMFILFKHRWLCALLVAACCVPERTDFTGVAAAAHQQQQQQGQRQERPQVVEMEREVVTSPRPQQQMQLAAV
jgi:hypothetical protein